MNPLVQMREVSYTYRTRVEDVRALHRFSFELNAGESVALMGPSGSGKSTVLLLLGLMRTIHEGEILVDGSAAPSDARSRARWRNRHVGFVFQEYAIIEDLCVWENVALPLEYGETRVSRRSVDAEPSTNLVGMASLMLLIAGRGIFPAGNVNASLSPGPRSTHRRSSSPTNPPRPSTLPPPRMSSVCWTGSVPTGAASS
ncbi:MAG: ATP-binding cassette domain-containing protein [Dermabacter sp.]|nr:ATP-binding cassette domain-containing protein [Dermabacter sp.]